MPWIDHISYEFGHRSTQSIHIFPPQSTTKVSQNRTLRRLHIRRNISKNRQIVARFGVINHRSRLFPEFRNESHVAVALRKVERVTVELLDVFGCIVYWSTRRQRCDRSFAFIRRSSERPFNRCADQMQATPIAKIVLNAERTQSLPSWPCQKFARPQRFPHIEMPNVNRQRNRAVRWTCAQAANSEYHEHKRRNRRTILPKSGASVQGTQPAAHTELMQNEQENFTSNDRRK